MCLCWLPGYCIVDHIRAKLILYCFAASTTCKSEQMLSQLLSTSKISSNHSKGSIEKVHFVYIRAAPLERRKMDRRLEVGLPLKCVTMVTVSPLSLHSKDLVSAQLRVVNSQLPLNCVYECCVMVVCVVVV